MEMHGGTVRPSGSPMKGLCRAMGALVLALSCAVGTAGAGVLYEEDFEGEEPTPTMHTNSKAYRIDFQGITDQEKAEGGKSYKIDITFEDGDYFYLMFPTEKFPLGDRMEISAKVFVKEGGHAGLGHNYLVPQSREGARGATGGCTTWKLWSGPTSGWETLVMSGNELRNQGEETCHAILTNPKILGVSAETMPVYLEIEDPLYDAWYINLRFMKGRRVVMYVDDVKITSKDDREDVMARAQGAQSRFEAKREALVALLEKNVAAIEAKAGAVPAGDAPEVVRLRNAFEQSRKTWEGPPADLYGWLVRAAAVGRFDQGVEKLRIAREAGPAAGRTTDALVFAVRPIVGPDNVPAPTQPPAATMRREAIEISVCPGEIDFGSLCVYAGTDALEDVTIRVSDLVGAQEEGTAREDRVLSQLPEPWRFKIDPDNKGIEATYFKAETNVSDWTEIRTDIEKGWDGQGFEKERTGYGWYRQRLAADAEAAKLRHRYLYFQAVDEDAYVYLDGRLIHEQTERTTGLKPNELWITPFAVKLDDVWSAKKDAELVVRVYNRLALGGIWKPVYLIASDQPLTDEQMKWMVFAQQTKPLWVPERRIDASAFDPYIVQWWYRSNPDDKKGPPLFRGELLVKDPTMVVPDGQAKRNNLKYASKEMRDAATLQATSLAAGRGVQYLLIARIPSQTPAGRYTGKVKVTSGGAAVAELPIDVRVLPFRLAEPILDYSIYYRGGKLGAKPTDYAPADSEHKTDAQIEADVADMLDHGIRHPIWYASHDRILAMRKRFAIRGPVMVTYPNAPRADQTDYIEWSAKVIEALRKGGCDPVYIAGPDEPNVDKMSYTREVIENSHRFLGVKVFAAVCAPLSWENLRQHLDLAIVHAERYEGRKGVARWLGDGKTVYTYGVASFHADAVRFRRYYGLDAWKMGCDGAAPYAYQHAGGDPWDSMEWHCNFTWPTVNGRVSTVQWEGMRAAVTDVRYVSTLVEWLGKTAGAIADHPARVAAERALAAIHPDADLDAQRAAIVKHILALRKAMSSDAHAH